MRVFCFVFGFGFGLFLLDSFLVEANGNHAKPENEIHIVYMGSHCLTNRYHHAQLLSELTQSNKDSVVQTYHKSFLGFAARMSKEEAKEIEGRDGVLSVSPDRVFQLHTTRSWDFLKSQSPRAHFDFDAAPTRSPPLSRPLPGNDIIVGIIDSGIWPESPSFNYKNMGPIPQRWNGTCMAGENFNSSTCNKKIIGARYYPDPKNKSSIVTTRDKDGHGTLVASVVAGFPVDDASYYGVAKGIARGGNPLSRIAAYCVCRPRNGGCVGSKIIKAFDDAIADGVDVLVAPIGYAPGQLKFQDDPIAIGAFHAMEKGILVVSSCGNDGPSPKTSVNLFPWALNVGATSIDRHFETKIQLRGQKDIIKGGGINLSSLNKSYLLVDGSSAKNKNGSSYKASNCVPGSLDDAKVRGHIILCENKDGYGIQQKFDMLKSQGAIGMIVIDNDQMLVASVYKTSPIAIVSEDDGNRILSYIKSTSNATATILPTQVILNYKPSSVIPSFSGRGPSRDVENLLKPDVVAPGVNILGAWPSNDVSVALPGKNPPLFNIQSGTSFSCAHVAAIAATVKSHHPDWSPSAIKSAIMTTAIQTNNEHAPITTSNGSIATPYDMGAGEVTLVSPLDPGLVYETEIVDYLSFLCNFGYKTYVVKQMSTTVPGSFSCPRNSKSDFISDMNYPSIAVTGLKSGRSRAVNRTVTNVGESESTYKATVEGLPGVTVLVVPSTLTFKENVQKLSFQVTFKSETNFVGVSFGSVTWSDGKRKVRSPIVIGN